LGAAAAFVANFDLKGGLVGGSIFNDLDVPAIKQGLDAS